MVQGGLVPDVCFKTVWQGNIPLYKKSLDTILNLVYVCAVVSRGYLLVCGKDKYACKFV